jgi:hypothetical protein
VLPGCRYTQRSAQLASRLSRQIGFLSFSAPREADQTAFANLLDMLQTRLGAGLVIVDPDGGMVSKRAALILDVRVSGHRLTLNLHRYLAGRAAFNCASVVVSAVTGHRCSRRNLGR